MYKPNELKAARELLPQPIPRDERPFQLERALELYRAGLPRSETRTTQAWRTERWLRDWGCDAQGRRYEGLLGDDEAKFWWIAWTLVARLGDDATKEESVDLLRTAWAVEAEVTADRDWCRARLERLERAASSYYDVWALTSMAPSATMLRVLLGRTDGLRFVLDVIPPRRLAPWVRWIGAPTLGRTAYRAAAEEWASANTPSLETLPAWRELALHSRSPGVVSATRGAAEPLASKHRFAREVLEDVARADETPGAYSDWAYATFDLPDPARAHEMVARDADHGIDRIAAAIARLGRSDSVRRSEDAEDLIRSLRRLPDGRFVEPLLSVLERPDAGAAARTWLHQHGGNHFGRLFEIAAGRTPHRRAALDVIAQLERLYPGELHDTLGALDPEERGRMAGLLERLPTPEVLDEEPAWAAEFLDALDWGKPLPASERSVLPALTTAGRELPVHVVDGILATLSDVRLEVDLRATTPRDEAPAALDRLARRLDTESASAFARALFDVWLRSKDRHRLRWCMRSVAFLGDDDALDHLARHVLEERKWIGAEDALSCLDALRRHGSAYALTLLGWIWQFHRAPRVRRHARIELEAVANVNDTTVDRLLDREVPSFRFRLDGTRPIAIGEKTIVLEVMSDGRVGRVGDARLPRRSTDEDPRATDAARDAVRAIGLRVERVAELQVARWERAMVEVRTVPLDRWERRILGHPILRQLARGVLWKICDDDGELLSAVRVGDDFTLSGMGDVEVTAQAHERIGVVHPAELSPGERERWNALFADYELIQPFEQLHRNVYRPGEHDIAGLTLETQLLRARMSTGRWEPIRGANQMIVGFRRRFGEVGITARIELADGFAIRPIAAGGLVPEDAKIASLEFRDEWGEEMPAERAPAGIVSEVLANLLEPS